MADMPNVVGERFQITIDKKIREELGIQPGDRAVERVENGRLVIDFAPRPHNESMLGILKKYGTGPIEPITDWQGFFDRAWLARGAELDEVLEADSRRHATPRTRPSR
jgi:AbrB family looped-hinge helix DNA binding protein